MIVATAAASYEDFKSPDMQFCLYTRLLNAITGFAADYKERHVKSIFLDGFQAGCVSKLLNWCAAYL